MMRASLVTVGLLAAACGGGVPAIYSTDSRLPAEGKQRLAEAEDDLAVSLGQLRARREEREEIMVRVDRFEDLDDLWEREGGNLMRAREALLAARVELADRRIEEAEARAAVDEARLRLARAEVLLRYAFAAPDLEPVRKDIAELVRDRDRAVRQSERARTKLGRATDRLWREFASSAARGGRRSNALWLE
jgi:hypothetical protein